MDPAGESDATNRYIYCRGVDTNSQPCDCEEFFAKSQDKGHCVECGHGRSKHPRKVSGYTRENVQDEPRPSSSATVKKILDQITGASVDEKPSTMRRGSLPLTTAQEEAISTLSSTQIASYNKLAKGPAPIAKKPTHTQLVKCAGALPLVASIAILTCGVDRNGLLRETKAPGKGGQNEIQAMRNCRCYLDQQFRIDTGWTYSMIMRNLRTWFPKVFSHLDRQVVKRASQLQATQEDKPIWRLLNKTGLMLTVVDVAFPTGIMRNQVPEDVYESWNMQPIILLSDTDSLAHGKSDNELASSLMELDITDDEVKHSDSKGKMKARLPRRTNHLKRALSPNESLLGAKVVVQKKIKKEAASDASIPLFFMDSGSSSSEAPPSTQPTQSSSLQTALFRSQVPAAVLQLKNKLSSSPAFVSVSKDDVMWRNKPEDDDPFAPERINPWDSRYVMAQNPATFLV
ncbi:hypothetical protein BDR04DRAFT_1122289 [Suillus decipiens]|nr:hypothetical protein BDR04DRAFT_1122289 [Suillus decipiens]